MALKSNDSWQIAHNRKDRRELLTFLSAVRNVHLNFKHKMMYANNIEMFWKIVSRGNSKMYWLLQISSFSSEDFSEYAGSRTSTNTKLSEELHTAARRGDLINVQRQLRIAACHIDASDNRGSLSALHVAARNGHMEVVTFLVSQGASLNIQDKYGRTALHEACEKGHTEVVTFLVEQGASLATQDNDGMTALHEACWKDNLEVVTTLVNQGASLTTQDRFGKTPLGLAEACGKTEVVAFLRSRGIDTGGSSCNIW